MKLLANPLLLRMAVVFIAAAVAFVIGLFAIRQLRHSVQADAALEDGKPSSESFPLHTYHAVIQQLKQQKHELEALQQAERRRAKASENISAAILSNISSGVLFFNGGGLVRQANATAKTILGSASPIGMNAAELFRNAAVRGGLNSERTPLAEAVLTSLRTLSRFDRLEADYVTPGGEARILEITITPVHGANAEILGTACLINDQTEIVRMRRESEPGAEVSPELLTALQGSIERIAAGARSLAGNHDNRGSQQLASDLADEAERLRATVRRLIPNGAAHGAASGMSGN